MSVLVEAITVIVLNSALDKRAAADAFARLVPNVTFRSDAYLSALGFMTPSDVEVFVQQLSKLDLIFVEDGQFKDIAVVDAVHGLTLPCSWLSIGTDARGVKFAWLKGADAGPICTYPTWRPENKLRYFPREAAPALQVDDETGLEVFIDDRGVKQYLGKVYREGHPDTRLARARDDCLHAAKREIWNHLLARGWLGIATSKLADPVYHLAMRYKNQLGLIFIQARWGSSFVTRLEDRTKARLLSYANDMRAVPVLADCAAFAPIHIKSVDERADGDAIVLSVQEGDISVQQPTIERMQLNDLRDGALLNEGRLPIADLVEISDWELSDLAVQIARGKLQDDGFAIEHWNTEPSLDPHVIAAKGGKIYRIVVGAARYPETEPIFDQNRLMATAETALVVGGVAAKVAVSVASSTDDFTGENARPLYRGEGVLAKYRGLEVVDPATCFANRLVKIFVSSTFQDFDAERELIRRQVLPELHRRASARGVSVAAIDLRWGIPKAAATRRRQLELCLSEISACHPFFVCLMGKRYGSMTDRQDLTALPQEYRWLSAQVSNLGITELEIRSALLRPHTRNSSGLVYARYRKPTPFHAKNPDIAREYRPLLKTLRDRGYHIKPIDVNFPQDITESLWNVIARHYPGRIHIDDQIEYARDHRQFGLRKAVTIPEDCAPVTAARELISGGQHALIACRCSVEASTIAAAVSLVSRRQSSTIVFEHYAALPYVADISGRLTDFSVRTTGQTGSGGLFPAIDVLQQWAKRSGRRVLLVFADTDLLGTAEFSLLTGLRSFDAIDLLATRVGPSIGWLQAHWPSDSISAYIETFLRAHGKSLDHDHVGSIVGHPLAGDFAFAHLICSHLIGWARFSSLSHELDALLASQQFADLGSVIRSRAEGLMSDTQWSTLANLTLRRLSSFTEAEVLDLSKISPATLSGFLAVVTPMLEAWRDRMWSHRGPQWEALNSRLAQ